MREEWGSKGEGRGEAKKNGVREEGGRRERERIEGE